MRPREIRCERFDVSAAGVTRHPNGNARLALKTVPAETRQIAVEVPLCRSGHRSFALDDVGAAGKNACLQPTDPHEYVMRLALGHVAARAVYALAYFRIVDHLAAGACSAGELARLTGADESSLLRLLRAAAALLLVNEEAESSFTLTPYGEALRSDASRHAASATLAIGHSGVWRAIGELPRALEMGQPLPAALGGAKPFADAPSGETSLTADAMIAFYGDEPDAVAAAYDFSGIRLLADLGGSSGNLLTTILSRNPEMQGILFDLPYTAGSARRRIERQGLTDRCRVISGSFFESIPPGADAYILSHVLHDWPPEKCETILHNVRTAARGARLLIVEPILTSGPESNEAKLLDIMAMTVTGGRHRTAKEFQALLAHCGFRVTRIVPTPALVSIIECMPS